MKRVGITLGLLLGAASAFAQGAHPRHMMTAAMLTRLEAKRVAGAAEWLSIKASCDGRVQTTAGTPDSLPPVYASKQPITSTPPGYIFADYQGFGYEIGVRLAICYWVLRDADPTLAAKYAAQAKKIALAASYPFASVTPTVTPAGWLSRGVTALAAGRPVGMSSGGSVTNEGPGGQARVYIAGHNLVAGAEITISGVTGCTTANTIGKIAALTAAKFDLVGVDGVTPVICNAPGTNYNHPMYADAVYPIRTFGPVVSQIYDLLPDGTFSAGEKTQLFNTLNAFYDTFVYVSRGYWCRAISNYQAGFFNAAGMIGILTRGAGENPRGEEIYQAWRNVYYELKEKPFFNRWLGPHGGFPEGIRYQALSASGWAETLLAQWESNSEDLFGAGEFPWVVGLMKYWVHNTMPPRGYMSYRGFIPSPADATGTNPQPWEDLAPAYWIVHHIADLKSDAFRPKFKQWLEDLQVSNGALPYSNEKLLYWDSALSGEDWTTETPSLPQLTNPLGDYGRVSMRSDWTTGAVFGDIWSTPGITDFGNFKERKDKGSIFVQRGNVHLLVSPTAEATRANNVGAFNYFHDNGTANYLDEGFLQGVFYTQRGNTPFAAMIQNRAGTAAFRQPGWDDCYPGTVITSNPCRVDEYEDTGEYVYSRSVRLNEVYYSDTVYTTFFPIKGWDREILYVRPKVFVVYDRTRKTNKTTAPTAGFTQHMSWNVGKTPVTSAYSTGFRTEVVDGATYKGGLTFLLPAAMPEPTLVNLNNYSLVYQLRAKPLDHATEYNNWLTVVDAADAQANLETTALFATRSNVDVIRLGDDIVVGFTSYQNGASPVFPLTYTMADMSADDTITHYLCGLTASTTYKRTVSGNDVTIATSGGGTDTISTAAGCVEFTSTAGGGGDPDVVVTTADPMPAGEIGVPYNECLAATGGDGGPYTFTVDDGAVPSGTTLTAGCVTGTPDTAETAAFDIVADDGTLFSAPKSLTITIAANPPVITETPLPNGVDDEAYSTTVCATGGTEPYVFTVSVGALPTGLTLNTASPCATITGTPTVVGTTNFTLLVTDDDAATDTWATSIQVTSALTQMTGSVQVGSNAVLVVFGASGLPAGLACTVTLSDETGTVIQTNQEVLRFAKQRSSFRGLSQITNYGVSAACPGSTPTGIISFTTRATVAAGDTVVPITLKPSAIHSTATQVTVNWGVDSTSENAETLACTSGCTVEITVPGPDIYTYNFQFKTAGGTVLATSNTRELIIP